MLNSLGQTSAKAEPIMCRRNTPGVASLLFVVVSLIFFTSCKPEFENIEPTGTTSRTYQGLSNLSSNMSPDFARELLGRALFYDRALSRNNSVSCGSCHKQSSAFADHLKLSRGAAGMSARNTIAIQDLSPDPVIPSGYGSIDSAHVPGGFFWDGRERSLNELVVQPITNHVEMGIDNFDALVAKLSNRQHYRILFSEAFSDGRLVTREHMAEALGSFIATINSSRTKFDDYNSRISNNEPVGNILSSIEAEGFSLFRDKYNCNTCHQVDKITRMETRFANIGLDLNDTDKGLADMTRQPGDVGVFRVPSLRNIEYTAPYMHDGRLATLRDVVKHYSDQIVDHPNLHADLKNENGGPRKMNISEHETEAIVAFLKTLSDKSILSNPRFSDPFKGE
jgi:cytochrome c peroxidase